MTLTLPISERIRLLRQKIAELELADKIAPSKGALAKSDRTGDNNGAVNQERNRSNDRPEKAIAEPHSMTWH
jgi:hypothetical protein